MTIVYSGPVVDSSSACQLSQGEEVLRVLRKTIFSYKSEMSMGVCEVQIINCAGLALSVFRKTILCKHQHRG